MTSHTTGRFRKCYQDLPVHVRQQARKAYHQFRDNPAHPSLQFKQVHPAKPIYSARVALGYRALGTKEGDAIIWFWIGSHADYDQLLRR